MSGGRSARAPRGASLCRLAAGAWLAVSLAACGGGGGSDAAVPPSVVISSNVAGAANGPVQFIFAFSEDVGTSFVASDVLVSAGTKGSFSRLDAARYSLVVVPPADGTGQINLSVAADAYTNLAGVPAAAPASLVQAYDTQAPTLVISSSAAGTTARGDVTLRFTFSEDVGSSFTTDDVQLAFSGGSVGTKGLFTRISGTQASLVVSPPAGAAGTVNISIAAGVFSDLAGNASSLGYFGAQAFDTR